MAIRAIAIMVLSMALLALSDAAVKLSGERAPMGQIMFLLSTGGTLLFVAMAKMRGLTVWSTEFWHPMVILRNGFEIIGAIGLIVGITHVPLSIFAAIMQVAPLVTILGAALFLGEKVGWRRWAAVLVGMTGMLIVIRPLGVTFSGWELFAVMGVSGLAGRDLVTRLAPSHIPALTLSAWGFGSTIPVGIGVYMFETMPLTADPIALARIFAAVLFTSFGYLAVTIAMRMAPVSIVAPFRYTRLLFTTSLGIMIFGERPDGYTLFGAGLVLAAGVYSFWREAKNSRAPQA